MPSLQQLENKNWGDPGNAPTALTKRCIELTTIAIENFSTEDLRIMIGQGFGLIYLIPLAIEKLQENILAEGDFYPGDLLKNVIAPPSDFWIANKNLYAQLKQIIIDQQSNLEEENISVDKFMAIDKNYPAI